MMRQLQRSLRMSIFQVGCIQITSNVYLVCAKKMTHYVEFLDMFAPSVVTSWVWNDDLLVEAACKGGLGAFEQLLTVTDQAFILLAWPIMSLVGIMQK